MLQEVSARAAASGAVAFGAVAAIAFVPAPTAQAATSFPVAPNTNHSRVLQTPLDRCRAALADPNGVLVIGDSITGLGFADITTKFAAAGRPVCINARGGRRTDEGSTSCRVTSRPVCCARPGLWSWRWAATTCWVPMGR